MRNPDGSSLDFRLGGYIRLSTGDTIMEVEKKERICDEKGNRWIKLAGRPRQAHDDHVRLAQNDGFFFRYVYENDDIDYRRIEVGTPAATIESGDILQSSSYEDNLGGRTEIEQITTTTERIERVELPDTIHEAHSWGTTVTGQVKPTVNSVSKMAITSVNIPDNAVIPSWVRYETSLHISAPGYWTYLRDPRAGTTIEIIVSLQSDDLFIGGGSPPSDKVGSASGHGGFMNQITHYGSWLENDVTNDTVVNSHWVSWKSIRNNAPSSLSDPLDDRTETLYARGSAIISKRTITLKSDSAYLAELQAILNSIPNASGSEPRRVEQNFDEVTVIDTHTEDRVTHVIGGHRGYSFTIKSKGEVNKRYNVDFRLGDTVHIDDSRLDVTYTGVVSGAIETIDGNGYGLEIEIDKLGATLEQRISGVI